MSRCLTIRYQESIPCCVEVDNDQVSAQVSGSQFNGGRRDEMDLSQDQNTKSSGALCAPLLSRKRLARVACGLVKG